ncbi:MAG: TRAP transporter small permease subunit [Albidovulum sp.]|nr:TRAP transporter small permease subunit [Albidovulum sp.]MDE0530112.1 TRAP transporter small permease subunit [Albidovulum sp.]
MFATFLGLLERINTRLLALGRAISVVAIGLMVFVILLQVFFRYVLNNALPWPDEAARFCMLWMVGLMAPSAYRWGSFVSIDMVKDRIGGRAGGILNLIILLLGLAVFVVAMQFAMKHIASGWLFNSSSLKIPLDWIGYEVVRVKLAWMYMSLPVGFFIMILVNVELTLKQIHMLFDPGIHYEPAPDRIEFSAE